MTVIFVLGKHQRCFKYHGRLEVIDAIIRLIPEITTSINIIAVDSSKQYSRTISSYLTPAIVMYPIHNITTHPTPTVMSCAIPPITIYELIFYSFDGVSVP